MPAARWDANLYDTKHAFVSDMARGLVHLLNARAGEQILDLGCGTGTLTSEIAAGGALVLGVDRSPEMIAEARAKFPGIEFAVCDARELRYRRQFDAVFSNAVLHWIPEAEQVIQGVAQALRPGGRFVAEFGGKGNVQRVIAALEAGLTKLELSASGANPWYYPSIAAYSALLEKHQLEVLDAALFDRPTKLEDGADGLQNWVTMFCSSYLERVPADQQPEFLRAVEEAARPNLWKSDHWELDYRRLRIAARKIAV